MNFEKSVKRVSGDSKRVFKRKLKKLKTRMRSFHGLWRILPCLRLLELYMCLRVRDVTK